MADEISVSAKRQLGYETTDLAMENARAVEAANASFITVHARTKVDGYHYPARWEWLGKINDVLTIPLVANGDIHSVDEFLRCREMSHCENFMWGRDAVIQPDLARQISAVQSGKVVEPMLWHEVVTVIIEMTGLMRAQPTMQDKKVLGRIKQWLAYLKRHYPEAALLFSEIRGMKQLQKADDLLWLNSTIGKELTGYK